MTQGLFITLEGGEGAGKSTQIRLLAEALQKSGREVVLTREPGGTPEAEKIRNFLVQRDGGDWTPMAECLLLYAARQMHVETLIKPALAAGKIVISDRFTDSTRAYQSYGGGLPIETIENLNTLVLGDFAPDLTFILDLPVEIGLARSGKRLAAQASQEDRFENMGTAFHERLRLGFLEIAKKEPTRCHVIDATQSLEDVAASLWGILKGHLA
ncbi:MAG: dTMP kinase [Micavibrio sp.]